MVTTHNRIAHWILQPVLLEYRVNTEPSWPKGDVYGRSKRIAKRTAAGIPTWSPTVVLICRSTAYVWQSGRDAQFSADYGRTCHNHDLGSLYSHQSWNNRKSFTFLAIAMPLFSSSTTTAGSFTTKAARKSPHNHQISIDPPCMIDTGLSLSSATSLCT